MLPKPGAPAPSAVAPSSLSVPATPSDQPVSSRGRHLKRKQAFSPSGPATEQENSAATKKKGLQVTANAALTSPAGSSEGSTPVDILSVGEKPVPVAVRREPLQELAPRAQPAPRKSHHKKKATSTGAGSAANVGAAFSAEVVGDSGRLTTPFGAIPSELVPQDLRAAALLSSPSDQEYFLKLWTTFLADGYMRYSKGSSCQQSEQAQQVDPSDVVGSATPFGEPASSASASQPAPFFGASDLLGFAPSLAGPIFREVESQGESGRSHEVDSDVGLDDSYTSMLEKAAMDEEPSLEPEQIAHAESARSESSLSTDSTGGARPATPKLYDKDVFLPQAAASPGTPLQRRENPQGIPVAPFSSVAATPAQERERRFRQIFLGDSHTPGVSPQKSSVAALGAESLAASAVHRGLFSENQPGFGKPPADAMDVVRILTGTGGEQVDARDSVRVDDAFAQPGCRQT